jgi:hypothetical protein
VLAALALLPVSCTALPGAHEDEVRVQATRLAALTVTEDGDESTPSPAMDRRALAGRLEHQVARAQIRGDGHEEALAAYLLSGLHARAAEAPFLEEPTSHLVAAIDSATLAREQLEREPERTEVALSGLRARGRDELRAYLHVPDVQTLEQKLELVTGACLMRLGFVQEPSDPLLRDEELLDPTQASAALERLHLMSTLRPWVCALFSVRLRERDELRAYRFAVLALEGPQRFGHGLDAAARADLEDWILNGARMRFVCPRSQTAYVPGLRRSPISGVPHFEYVAVRR